MVVIAAATLLSFMLFIIIATTIATKLATLILIHHWEYLLSVVGFRPQTRLVY